MKLDKIPYNTSYGKLINMVNINKELVKFTVTSNHNINYEYYNNRPVKLMFITGCSQEEKELPIWNHPTVVKDLKENYVVAIDMRKYVNIVKECPLHIKDIAKDKNNLNYMVLRGMLIADIICEEIGVIRNSFKNIITGYSMFISGIINTMALLNPLDKVKVEVVAAYFVSVLLSNSSNIADEHSGIIARISKLSLSLPTQPKIIEDILSNININANTVDGLIDNIKKVVSPDKTGLINTNVLVNMVSNMWYGPGGTETVLMALEDMATWISLLYVATSDKTYKRSRLSMVLEKYDNKIKSDEFIKAMDLYIKEYTSI